MGSNANRKKYFFRQLFEVTNSQLPLRAAVLGGWCLEMCRTRQTMTVTFLNKGFTFASLLCYTAQVKQTLKDGSSCSCSK
jgi:hypothetical protein